jgi:predicted Zn-dependent protease
MSEQRQANSAELGEKQAAGRTETNATTLPGLSGSGVDLPPNLPQIDISRQPKALASPLIPKLMPPPAPPQPVVPKTTKQLEPKYDVNRIGDRKIGKGLDFYSLQKEVELGRALAEEVEAGAKMVKDPVVTEYVNRVGQNLVRNSDARVPFTIKVVDNDEINAYALPGGFFYVNTGLILAADNEAELAGVMAHEIAHVAARHATKNATRSEILNLASIPLIFVGGPAGYAARQVIGLAMPLSMLKFSRDAEREADMLGLEYQYASGYDPEEFVKFFEKLRLDEKKKLNFFAKAFATHPMTQDRIKRAQEEIADYLPARDGYIVDTSEFQEVKRRVQGIEDSHRIDNGKASMPTLRKRTQ